MKNLIKNFIIFFAVFLVLAGIFSFFGNGNFAGKPKSTDMNVGALVQEINNGNVTSIVVEGTKLTVTLNDKSVKIVQKEQGDSLSQLLKNYNVPSDKIDKIDVQVKNGSGGDYWLGVILPIVLPVLIIGFLIYFMMRSVAGANSKAMMFGQSGAKEFREDSKNKTTFKDVAGSEEAKEELKEVIEFLRFPKKFREIGARIPRGFLLLGAPGTGKTLMARAVAGEANVPFFHISGSEFVEMFVGVGASRVRDLFNRAKKTAPCIIFIDEIDAVGRRRGAGLGGSHDEREQTLNQILVEMDGFDGETEIIVIAATNRPDVLDPALLRPGRFDRQVVLEIPDLKEREAILKVHCDKKPLAADVDLKKIAERTSGFSGADLANLLNEAAIATAKADQKEIKMQTIFDSIEKVMIGPERKSRVITDREKKITAYHEAGHALVAHNLKNVDPVQKISIISRGRAAGYTLKTPLEDRRLHSKGEFVEELAVLVAGRMAEKLIFNDVTTGASSDLRIATDLAKAIVTEYGMSDKLPMRTFGNSDELVFLGREMHEARDYSEKTSEAIDTEVGKLFDEAVKTAVEILNTKKADLEKIVAALMIKETMEKDEFEAIVGKKIS
ncbi:MAG: ATP-dependent zinc metalloprotease FtsH [Patescibacteria group bacterium]|nr:ATP-dependent zinc metalloprotease FtsH [Patescibacteria group bacterium]